MNYQYMWLHDGRMHKQIYSLVGTNRVEWNCISMPATSSTTTPFRSMTPIVVPTATSSSTTPSGSALMPVERKAGRVYSSTLLWRQRLGSGWKGFGVKWGKVNLSPHQRIYIYFIKKVIVNCARAGGGTSNCSLYKRLIQQSKFYLTPQKQCPGT